MSVHIIPSFRRAWMALAGIAILVFSAQAFADDSSRYLVRYESGAKQLVLASLGDQAVIHHEFDDLGVIAVTLPDTVASLLGQLAGVIDVSEDPVYFPFAQTVPYGIDLVHARDEWDANRDDVIDAGAATGDGIRVCVVDTGIAADHEDLRDLNILAGLSFVNEDWAADRQGHGTHVAGTVAAMHNDVGVVGVSPGTVELIIADVFNDLGEGQASSTILAAANWCADQGANIISMSLGGPIGTLADGYQALYERGILIIAAAGNDGAPVLNYPAAYPHVVSVAAIDAQEAVASFSTFNPDVEVAAPGVAVLSTYPFKNSVAVTNGPEYSANAIANADPQNTSVSGALADGGDCNTAVPAGTYQGQVVLCERGGVPFRTKIDNAAAGGAVAAVIYNNVAGNFNGTYGDPCCSTIPAVSLSQADGQDALGFVGIDATVNVNFVSTSGYAELSGTSMATPHASATAAVLWSACPDLTNDQVRSHLAATTRESQADLLAGRDMFYGYGIVQVREGVAALSDGIDGYNAAIGNDSGNNPANVECAVGGDAQASGGGWLPGESSKVTFSFDVEGDASGGSGELLLKDHGRDVRIAVSQINSVSVLTEACGPVPAGDNAVAILGEGTFNSQTASFRACAADNGKPGKNGDRFHVECTSGCTYDTASSSAGVIGGGNIDVVTSSSQSTAGEDASTLMLDPLLMGEGTVGALQVFTVRANDAATEPLAGAAVTIIGVAADGTESSTAVVTDASGQATATLSLPLGTTKYRAIANGAESNPVIVTTD